VASEHGDAEGQYRLGMMYFRGQGVFPDPETGIRQLRLAAEQEYEDALRELELIHQEASGAPESA